MNRTLGRKILTSIALVAIIAQSFSPYIAVLPQKAYAQDATPTVDQTTPTPNQITPTVTETPSSDQTITPTPTDTITPTPTDTPTPEVTSEPTPTPTVDNTATATPTPSDNLSPPADNSNSQDSPSITPTPTVSPMPTNATPSATPTSTETSTGKEQISMTILKDVSAPSIDLNTIVEGSASLTTDKADYAPTDTALITGSNLIPNTEYALVISSSDNPVVNFSTNVTSDDKGTFVYAYQLGGKYRPNYKAELKDSDGKVVATTSFTDSPTTTVLVSNLQPDYTSSGGGGVNSAYYAHQSQNDNVSPVSPGQTATHDGKQAGVIKAGQNNLQWDEGLFGFKPTGTIDAFATGTLTYDVENQTGTNPVWMTIEVGDPVNRDNNKSYQFVPTLNPTVWHTVDAGVGQWYLMDNSGNATGMPMTLGEIATANTGQSIVRVYLRLGMGPGYLGSGSGTIAWVSNVTIGGTAYDFVIPTSNPTTKPATSITTTNATLNGTNGNYDATDHTFWVSLSPFTATLPVPAGIYSTPSLGSISAGVAFAPTLLSSLTTNGVPSVLPPITPNTTYYYAAWSEVGGAWYPGAVLNFTTQPGPVFIDTNKNGVLDSGEPSFLTIQSAINAAASGDTIHVTPGIYTEIGQIIINKNLSIVGTDKSTTIIKPDSDYSAGWFLVKPGITFNLSNVTLDGTGHIITEAIIHQGNGVIDNNKFTEIKGSGYAGTEIGRNGVLAKGNTGTVSGNTYTGKGTGDWLDYFILSEFGDNITISNNTISNNTGVAKSDGSTSAAIAVWDDPNTQAIITGNTMTNNTTGVAVVAFSGGTTSPKVTIGAGNLFDGGEYGVALQTWGPTFSPDITFVGASIFKGQTKQAIYIYDGVSVGKTIDISSVIFKDSSSNVITNSSAIEALLWHFPDDPKTGLLKWDYTAPAVPALVSPADGVYRHTSNSNKSDWTDVTDPSSPVVYYYESSLSKTPNSDGSFASTAYKSDALTVSEIMNPGEPEITYYWHVKACDAVGNCSAWSPAWQINIDNTNPTVPNLTSPSNNGFETTNDFYFTWTNSNDASPITYEFQSSLNPAQSGGVLTTGLWNSGTLPSNTIHSTGAPDGAWYWQVRAKDAAGNASAWSSVWKMTIDTTAPSAPGMPSTLPNPTNSTTQTWSWTAATDTLSGVANYAWRAVLGATTINDTTTTTSIITNLAEGIWNFFVKAIDNAGNESSESSGSVTVDTTAPAVPTGIYFKDTVNNKDVACGGATSAKNFDVYWKANTEPDFDHYEYVSFNVDGSTGPIRTFTTPYFNASWWTVPTEGTYGVQIRAVDKAGNKSAWSGGSEGINNSCTYTVDWTAPTVKLVFPTPGPSATSFQAVFSEDVNSTEATNPANYFLNNWPGAGGSGNLDGHATVSYNSTSHIATVTFTTAGWYISPEQQWGVQNIQDLAGNTQQSNPHAEYSTSMVKPVTTDSDTDSNWHNAPVTVTLSCTDVNGSGCKDTYYTTDGSTPTTSSTSGNSITLNTDGVYTIKYFSVDNAGNVEDIKTASNTVYVDQTPPTLPTATPVADDYTTDQLVTLNSTDSGSGLAGIFYTTDGSDPTTSGTKISYPLDNSAPISVDKDMAIKAIAYDNAGNASDILEANYGIIISPMTMISLNLSNQGGPGDGLSDGLSSCPSCTQAPQGSLGGGGNVLGASITAAQGSALLASAPLLEQTVLGAATKSATPTPSINPSPTGKTLVSSSANWVLNHLMLSLLILLVLAGLGYYLYRKRKKKQNS
jgi:hypothetical protein